MPGVKILNTTIHYKEVLPTWTLIVIIAIIVIPAVVSLIGEIQDKDLFSTIGRISLIFGLCVAFINGYKNTADY